MEYDKYGCIVGSSRKNCEDIARLLYKEKRSVLIAWTEGRGTQYDILFVYAPLVSGPIQGGLRHADLVVAIMRKGAFGFHVCNKDPLSEEYVAEKFSMGSGPTAAALSALITGVRNAISDILSGDPNT